MNSQSQITTKMLKKVKANLPANAHERISNDLGISVITVNNVLLGRTFKMQTEILEKALEIIDSEAEKKKDLSNKIKQL